MATYLELRTLFNDATLQNKMAVAVVVSANAIAADIANQSAARIAWAQKVLENPHREAKKVLALVLVQNKASTLVQINAASDDTIQTAVDAAVNVLSAVPV